MASELSCNTIHQQWTNTACHRSHAPRTWLKTTLDKMKSKLVLLHECVESVYVCISRVEATRNIALHTIEFGPFISGNDKSDISAISAGLKEISVQQTQNSLNPFSFKEKDCYFLWVSKHIKHKKQLGWDSTPSLQVSELLFLTKTLIAPLFLELNFFFQKTSEFGHWALDGIK